MKNRLFRITENDVYTIMENVVRRIIKESAANSMFRNVWDGLITTAGAENIVNYMDEEGYLDDIYQDLDGSAGLSYDEIVELPDENLLELMISELPPETIKWCIIDIAEAFGIELSEYNTDLQDDDSDSFEGEEIEVAPDGEEIEDDAF